MIIAECPECGSLEMKIENNYYTCEKCGFNTLYEYELFFTNVEVEKIDKVLLDN